MAFATFFLEIPELFAGTAVVSLFGLLSDKSAGATLMLTSQSRGISVTRLSRVSRPEFLVAGALLLSAASLTLGLAKSAAEDGRVHLEPASETQLACGDGTPAIWLFQLPEESSSGSSETIDEAADEMVSGPLISGDPEEYALEITGSRGGQGEVELTRDGAVVALIGLEGSDSEGWRTSRIEVCQ